MERETGYRVGAIMGGDDKSVKFFGYGVYEGDFELPGSVGGFNFGQKNPRIKLDSGKIVWGCECWWGPEENIKKNLEIYKSQGLEIIDVDIEEEREKSKGE